MIMRMIKIDTNDDSEANRLALVAEKIINVTKATGKSIDKIEKFANMADPGMIKKAMAFKGIF